MLLALVGWALASPVGAAPDDDYHLASIWCAYGARDAACAPGPTETSRLIPRELVYATCYAFNPLESAACQADQPTGPDLIRSDRGNFVSGTYPPVFYWFAGLFVGDSVGASVIAMRVANAVLYVALLTALYLFLSPGLRRPMITAALVTAVPLGIFIIPSINPSSWAMLSAVVVPLAVVGFLRAEDRRRRIGLGVLAAIGLLVGAGARADAAVYAVLATVAAVIVAVPVRELRPRRLVLPAGIAVVGALAFLSVGQSEAANPGTAPLPLSAGRLVSTMVETPGLWVGALGSWGLGWLDTRMPPAVWVASVVVYMLVLVLATRSLPRRHLLAVALVATALFVIPAYIGFVLGPGVQPRYILPLLTLLAVIALVRLSGTAFQLTRMQRWFVVGALAMANALALHSNMRRYLTGMDPGIGWNLNTDIEWWWSIPISPLAVWVVASVAFGAGIALITAELTTESPATGPLNRSSSVATAADGGSAGSAGGGSLPVLALASDPTGSVSVPRMA